MREFHYLLKFWGSNRKKREYSHTIRNRMWFASIQQNERREKIKQKKNELISFHFILLLFLCFGIACRFQIRNTDKIEWNEQWTNNRHFKDDEKKRKRKEDTLSHVFMCVSFFRVKFFLPAIDRKMKVNF